MELTKKEFEEKLKNGDKFLVDFWASFCGPCRVMKPWFEKVANEMTEQDDVKLYTFNIESDKDFVMSELGITSVPTIKGYRDGKEVYKNVGILREEQIKSVVKTL